MCCKGCRCGLATNVIWKAVRGSGTCIREGPLAELGMCPRHDIAGVSASSVIRVDVAVVNRHGRR